MPNLTQDARTVVEALEYLYENMPSDTDPERVTKEALSAARRLAAHVEGSGEVVAWISSDDMEALQNDGIAIVYAKEQERVFGLKWEQTPLSAHAAPSAWISVKERRPPDSAEILAQCYASDSDWMEVASFNGIAWFNNRGGMFHPKTQVTHWQPLPAPPAASEEGGERG